jgi:hypothetical protein
LIEDPGEARSLARAILSDVRLYASERLLSADSPEVAEGRTLFRSRVSPILHEVFEAVLAEPAPRKRGLSESTRTNLIGIVFLALLAGVGWFAYDRVLGPGQERLTQMLDGWLGEARRGHPTAPTQSGATTEAAMVAISTSTGHRITRDRGSFAFSGTGNTCFEVELTGPNGVTAIAVRVSDDPAPAHVTHVGLRPPCGCGRNGQATSCE